MLTRRGLELRLGPGVAEAAGGRFAFAMGAFTGLDSTARTWASAT